jgi:hypothetical protein
MPLREQASYHVHSVPMGGLSPEEIWDAVAGPSRDVPAHAGASIVTK